jgi:hypothetical protein
MTRRFGFMLGAIFAVATTTSAQTGQITGVVVDETGSVLAGVAVALTGPSFELATTTDGAGQCRFDNVVTGTYDLTARLSGFLDAVRASIAVSDGDVVAISPITLSLGVGEIVVVTAARTESALADAPATMAVLPGRALEVGPALNYGDPPVGAGHERSPDVDSRHQSHDSSREASGGHVAVGPCGWAVNLFDFFWACTVGLHADEHGRHTCPVHLHALGHRDTSVVLADQEDRRRGHLGETPEWRVLPPGCQ